MYHKKPLLKAITSKDDEKTEINHKKPLLKAIMSKEIVEKTEINH